ncbi:MAG: MFS transporter [Acidithiobacillus ferriphilus]|uniref:MFS transporter n=2 Tax=Acidithiobacillus TaxID=119977 RepID=A0A257T8W4_9PROT|nr:MFS transporter [Acidithiobacillus ferriphilus]OYV81993.1 MAG: MFS transporter [Acidithiobacillus ferrivorans]MBU2786385.1 MFS transporter [Acidithiobacillus ferriphilus]MBU2827366.1 MFS transporter [Acidithiobacillus ferriphilus]MBU2845811.1 MFS transporter [Acidithiobacillus ferriphilus]MEB8475775.1 MFS transporter [Acidithiobacillus ferriphilus]
METAQSLSKTWPLFAGVGLALGMGSFDGASVQGIFPYVAGGLSTSSDHALWTLTYFIVHWSLGITLMPWTTARFGMRRVFQAAVTVAMVGTVISVATDNLWIMLLSRALQGIAAGLLVPLSQSLFLRHSPGRFHGPVTIFWSNAMLVPFFFGPAIGGLLATELGYRSIFLLSLPIWGVALFLGSAGIPKDHGDPLTPPFDGWGFGLLYGGLMSMQVVLDQGEQYGWWHSTFILKMTLFAVVFLLLFAWRENETRHPLLQLHFLHRRNYWLGLLLLCLGWAMFMGWASMLPLWAEETLGFNGFWGSAVLIPIGLGAIPLSTQMDRLRGLLGLRRLTTLCFAIFAFAYGSAYLSPISSLSDLFWPMLFIGMGVGMLFVPLTMVILSGLSATEIPSAATTSNFIRVFSANIGVSLLSVYWARYSALASDHLRGHISRFDPETTLSAQHLHTLIEVQADTLSIDNLLRLSMWICLIAAITAYVFIIPPSALRNADGPRNYVEEEEDEFSTVLASAAAREGVTTTS